MMTALKITILAICISLPVLMLLVFRSKRKECALMFFSLLVSAGVAEALLWAYAPQVMQHDRMFEFDSNLGWRLIPDNRVSILYPGEASHYIATNSMGFRDDPFLFEEDGTSKIMVLGDSFVSNISVEADDVFTELMERRLENTSVMNFGVNGYGQVQEYLQLQQWFDRVEPDLIVLMVYVRNDFQDNLGDHWVYDRPGASWNEGVFTLTRLPPSAQDPGRPATPFWRAYRNSHLYNLLTRGLEMVASRWSPSELGPSAITPPEIFLCRTAPSDETARMYRIMEALLLEFSSYANDRGVPIVFAVAPSIVQVDSILWSSTLNAYGLTAQDYERSLPGDVLMGLAAKNDWLMVDLLPALLAESKTEDPLYNRLEQHWTKRGNEVVARALLDFLETNSLANPIWN